MYLVQGGWLNRRLAAPIPVLIATASMPATPIWSLPPSVGSVTDQ